MHEREGRAEERFRSSGNEVSKIDNLSYLITLAEQSSTNTASSIKEDASQPNGPVI
ncbi:hypothetical protein [Sinorhizobium meliloti]|uniref:hypothetical protein n=1 Tax=Rhizobium meliloti TaxID=382 RepID=UPI0013E3EB9D|nr:hypothetical protein [Sinorhizobium meliloti]